MAAAAGTVTASAAAASLKENGGETFAFALLPPGHVNFSSRRNLGKVSCGLAPRPELCLSSTGLLACRKSSALVRAQSNEVAMDRSLKAATSSTVIPGGSATESEDLKSSDEPPRTALGSEESVSELFSQISSIIKLVDSKDIVELQLKQPNYELFIRKKEALPLPPAPVTYVQSQPQPIAPQQVPLPSSVPTSGPSPVRALPDSCKSQPSKSTHTPLKCPMAGNFYRSPAPGEPPFVKVGDKVQKGQVICIIEAMKLMNEIEADQSGTIVEILAEDGKPVSIDMPLFAIEP